MMLVDKDGLWYNVLKARYREEGGGLRRAVGSIQLGGRVWRVFMMV
jgi:hypothetical protein